MRGRHIVMPALSETTTQCTTLSFSCFSALIFRDLADLLAISCVAVPDVLSSEAARSLPAVGST